ncbi:hypothetical protein RJT34_11107 [Clitoria ternatea]|uniref:Uncharacterized protein n=1 Tax=Clitoria ternatea TaxID=43366 RepID=A0AAN9JLB1_CLITE
MKIELTPSYHWGRFSEEATSMPWISYGGYGESVARKMLDLWSMADPPGPVYVPGPKRELKERRNRPVQRTNPNVQSSRRAQAATTNLLINSQ